MPPLGLGGYHLRKIGSEREAIRVVHEGRSETVMGKAIADRRERVFLMTKVCTHTGEAMRQLEQSLRRNVKVAAGFTPMSRRQTEALRKRVREEAEDGRFELYKTTAAHDGTVGRRQHGYPSEQELSAQFLLPWSVTGGADILLIATERVGVGAPYPTASLEEEDPTRCKAVHALGEAVPMPYNKFCRAQGSGLRPQ